MEKLTIDLGRQNTQIALTRREKKKKKGASHRFKMLKLAAVTEETGGGENFLVFTGADLQAEDINLLGCWTAKKGSLEPKAAHVIKLSDNHDMFGEATHRDHHTQQSQARRPGSPKDPSVVFASARKTMRKLQLVRALGVNKIDLRDTFELSPPPEDAYRAWMHFCAQLETTSVSRIEMANIKMRLVAWQVLLDSLSGLKQLATLVLNENPICGPKRAPDMHLSTWENFCLFVRTSTLTTLSVERVGLGPKGANSLLKAVRSKIDVLHRPRRQVKPEDWDQEKEEDVMLDTEEMTFDEMEKLINDAESNSDDEADLEIPSFTLSLRSNPGIVGELDTAGNLQALDRLTPIKTHEGFYEFEWPKTTWDRKRVPDAMKVSVPEGMGPGDKFKITTPAGTEIEVQVPLGKKYKPFSEHEMESTKDLRADLKAADDDAELDADTGKGDPFFVDLKACEMQMLEWQTFCRRLATVRIAVLDIRDIGMGPKAMAMLTEVISHTCLFTQSIQTLRIDSTGMRTYDATAFEVTSEGVVADRKDYTLERLNTELEFQNLDFGPADARLVAAWLGLSRHGAPVQKLTFDAVGLSKFDAGKSWAPDTITLEAAEVDIDMTGKNTGAADIELLAAWISLPHVAKNISKVTVEVIGGSRSVSTQAKPDSMGFLPDTTDLTIEECQPSNSQRDFKRRLFELDASKREANYKENGLGDTDLILLAAWIKHVVSPKEGDKRNDGVEPLKRLNICGNPYHLEGATVLAEVLSDSQLSELTLGSNMRDSVHVPINDPDTVKLNFRSKQLKPAHAVIVCAAMSTNKNLVTVNLLRNNFGDQIEHVIDTLEQRCKQLRTVSGIEPDVIATGDMIKASSVAKQDLPEYKARVLEAAASSKLLQATFQQGPSMAERMMAKRGSAFTKASFAEAREPNRWTVVNNKNFELEFQNLRRTNAEAWPAPAKAGFKFTCGTAAGGKECLWRTSPPKHMLTLAPFSCIEAGCTVCAEGTGFHPDVEPEVVFNPALEEQLAVGARPESPTSSSMRPFGIAAEFAHVPEEAYNFESIAGGLDTGSCWTPARMPKIVVHDPETGKTVRMNGHKVRWTVQTFVAQDLGTEWYEMDAGEVSCTDEVHDEAKNAVIAAERKVDVATMQLRKTKMSAKHVASNDSKTEDFENKMSAEQRDLSEEAFRIENELRKLKVDLVKAKEEIEEIENTKEPVTISGVVLRGNEWDEQTKHSRPGWVTEFVVSHSQDGKEWTPITHEVGETELLSLFTADSNPKTRVFFDNAILARFVRIHPTQWDEMDHDSHPIAMCAALVRAATVIDKGIRPCERWKDSNPVIDGRPLANSPDQITQPIFVKILSDECKAARLAAWEKGETMHSIRDENEADELTKRYPFHECLERARRDATLRNDSLTGPMMQVRKKDDDLSAWERHSRSGKETPGTPATPASRGGKRGKGRKMLDRPEIPVPLGPSDMKLLALDVRLARATIAVQKVVLCGNPITGSYFGTSDMDVAARVTTNEIATMTETDADEAVGEDPGSPTDMARKKKDDLNKALAADGVFDVDATGLRMFARSMASSNIVNLDLCGCSLGKYAMSKMGMSGMFDRGKDKQAVDAEAKASIAWAVVIEHMMLVKVVDPSLLQVRLRGVDPATKVKVAEAEESLGVALEAASREFQRALRARKDAVELRELNVSRNSYLLDGAEALAAVLPHTRLQGITVGPRVPTRIPLNARTEKLNLVGEDLDPADTIILAAALATYNGLRNVNLLGDHRLGEGGADALVGVFLKEPHLFTLLDLDDGMTFIDVANKGLDAPAAKILATELECGRTVRAATGIDLSDNNFIQELLTKGSTVMQIGTGQSGVTLCGPDNFEHPGSVRVSWDDNDATADWLEAAELAVLPQTDSWEQLCRAMMPRRILQSSGVELPAYGVPPSHAEGDATLDEFYQLRFGARIFLPLPLTIYNKSTDYWNELHISVGDPVIVQIIEAPAKDLVEMLLKHVDMAQEELKAAQTEGKHSAKEKVFQHVADPDKTAKDYAKTSLAYKAYSNQLNNDPLRVLVQKAQQVGLGRCLLDYGIADPDGWMSRFDGSKVWVEFQNHTPPLVDAQTYSGDAKKTVIDANTAYEKWAKRPTGSSGHEHLIQINTLILRNVGMGPLGLKIFAEALSPNIHKLDLADNNLLGVQGGRLDFGGWELFCKTLETSALQHLDVSGCHLTCTAMQALARTVRAMADRAQQMRQLLKTFSEDESRSSPDITPNEIFDVTRKLGIKLGTKAIKFLFAEMDEDGSNTISVEEFSHWIESHTLKTLTVDSTGMIDQPRKYTLSVESPSEAAPEIDGRSFDEYTSEEKTEFEARYGVWCCDEAKLSGHHISFADIELLASWQSKEIVHIASFDLSGNRITEPGMLSDAAKARASTAEQRKRSSGSALPDQNQALESKHLTDLKATLRKDAVERAGDDKGLQASAAAVEIANVTEKLNRIKLDRLHAEELGHVERPTPKDKGMASPMKHLTATSSSPKKGDTARSLASPEPEAVDDVLVGVAEDYHTELSEVDQAALASADAKTKRKFTLLDKLRKSAKLVDNITGKSAVFNAGDLEKYRQRVKEEQQNDGSRGLSHLGVWLDGDGGAGETALTTQLKKEEDRLSTLERLIPETALSIESNTVALNALDGESVPLTDAIAKDQRAYDGFIKEKTNLERAIPKSEAALHEVVSGKVAHVDMDLSGCTLHGSAVANMLDGLSVPLISLNLSSNNFTHESKLAIAATLAELQVDSRKIGNDGVLEIGTLKIDLGAAPGTLDTDAHVGDRSKWARPHKKREWPLPLHVSDRSIDVKSWGLREADQMILGSWFGMVGPQAHLTKLNLSGNELTVEGAQALAKHIKTSNLQEIVLGNDVPLAVHDSERKLLLTTEQKDACPQVFVETRHVKGGASGGAELLTAADAVMLAPILETLPAIEILSLRGNLEITGGSGPMNVREYGQEMAGWDALCESWTDPTVLPNLKKLDISKCGLNNIALEKLAPVLMRKDTAEQLQELALSDNDAITGKEMDRRVLGNVNVEDVDANLAEMLWVRGGNINGWKKCLDALTHSNVVALYVDNCRLGDDAFKILANHINNMLELRELSIWRNKLSITAARHLGQALLWQGANHKRVKLQRLIFGSDSGLRPVRNGDGVNDKGFSESGLQCYSHTVHDFDFSPPVSTDGSGGREGWNTEDLNQARIRGGGAMVLGTTQGYPRYPYEGVNAPPPNNVEYGDALLLMHAIFTSADNRGPGKGGAGRGMSHLINLDLRCIPLNTESKKLLGELVSHSCLQTLTVAMGAKDHRFDCGAESSGWETDTLDLSHSDLQFDDVYVLTGWLKHNPQVNSSRTTPKYKQLRLFHNMDVIGDDEFGTPKPSWTEFCHVLGNSDIVTVDLGVTRLCHSAAILQLSLAAKNMLELQVLSVKGNDMKPDDMVKLESSKNGGPKHMVSFFELHSGNVD